MLDSGRLWPYLQILDYPGMLARHKHSSLLQIFVNYSLKSFITLGPGVNAIKHFSSSFKLQINKLERLSLSWYNIWCKAMSLS